MNMIFFLVNGMQFTIPWQWNEQCPNMEILKKMIKANDGLLTDQCFIAGPPIVAIMVSGQEFTFTPAQAPTAPTSDTKQ